MGQLLADTMSDHRSRLWSSDVSSTRVAMVHTCPDGSMTHPMRLPLRKNPLTEWALAVYLTY